MYHQNGSAPVRAAVNGGVVGVSDLQVAAVAAGVKVAGVSVCGLAGRAGLRK